MIHLSYLYCLTVSPNPLQSLGLVGGAASPVSQFSAQTGASNVGSAAGKLILSSVLSFSVNFQIAALQSAPTAATATAMNIQPNMQV